MVDSPNLASNRLVEERLELFQKKLQILLRPSLDIDSDKRLSPAGPDEEPATVLDVDPDPVYRAGYPIPEPRSNLPHHIVLLLVRTVPLLLRHIEGRQTSHQPRQRPTIVQDRVEYQNSRHGTIPHRLMRSIEYPAILLATQNRLLPHHLPRHVDTPNRSENHPPPPLPSRLSHRHRRVYRSNHLQARLLLQNLILNQCQTLVAGMNRPRLVYEDRPITVAVMSHPKHSLLLPHGRGERPKILRPRLRRATREPPINIIVDRDHSTAYPSKQDRRRQRCHPISSINHDSHSLLDFLPSNICAKARQIRLEGLRRIPSLSWALADPPGFSRKQPFYRLLLVTRDLDSIRVDHLEPVILGRVVASSNHHTSRIPGQFYQELEPRGGNLSTIFNIISVRKYTSHNTFSKHRTRGSSVTANQNPPVLE